MADDFWSFRSRDTHRLDDELENLASLIIGAAIDVHKELGAGLPEIAYKRALSHELVLRNVEHVVEAPVPVHYKGLLVAEGKVDILVKGRLVVELKVVSAFDDVHTAQVIAYLSALNLELGLLLNFNVCAMKDGVKRVIRSKK